MNTSRSWKCLLSCLKHCHGLDTKWPLTVHVFETWFPACGTILEGYETVRGGPSRRRRWTSDSYTKCLNPIPPLLAVSPYSLTPPRHFLCVGSSSHEPNPLKSWVKTKVSTFRLFMSGVWLQWVKTITNTSPNTRLPTKLMPQQSLNPLLYLNEVKITTMLPKCRSEHIPNQSWESLLLSTSKIIHWHIKFPSQCRYTDLWQRFK